MTSENTTDESQDVFGLTGNSGSNSAEHGETQEKSPSPSSPTSSGTKLKAYLAGPMRGKPMNNFPKFFQVAMALRHRFDIVNPAEMQMAEGNFDPAKGWDEQGNPFNIENVLKQDFQILLGCEAIILIDGWKYSEGAKAEALVAKLSGLRMFNERGHRLEANIVSSVHFEMTDSHETP